MVIQKTLQGVRVSSLVGTQLMSRHFIGYTQKQAVQKFKKEVEQLYKNIIV